MVFWRNHRWSGRVVTGAYPYDSRGMSTAARFSVMRLQVASVGTDRQVRATQWLQLCMPLQHPPTPGGSPPPTKATPYQVCDE